MKLVGIVEFNNQVVEDDTDQLPTNVVYTPAFTRLVPDDASEGTWYGIQLVHGDRDLASTEQALLRALPPGATGNFSVTSITEAKVERAVKPESIALGAFGLIALMAALGMALPVMARQLRSTEDDRQIMRALGAEPATTLLDGLSGMLAAIVAGALLACAIAVALSPLSPLGPIRRVYHPSVLVFDWTVLGGGLALLAGGLGTAATFLSRPGHASPARTGSSSRPVVALQAGPVLVGRSACPCRGWWACTSPSSRGGAVLPYRPDGSWPGPSSP